MALVANKTRNTQETKPETDSKKKVVDIFAADAPKGKTSEINVEEDAWERIAPPPMGRYSLQLFLGENTPTLNEDEKTGEFVSYSIAITAKVINHSVEEYNGATCFPNFPVTTKIGRGKSISTAAGLLVKLGYDKVFKPGVAYSDLSIAQALVKALKKEPIIANNLCDWKASYAQEKKNGQTQYVNVALTMDDFPKDANGEPEHIYKVTKRDGSLDELPARFFIKEWGGKGSKVEEEVAEEVVEVATVPTVKEARKSVPVPVKKAPEPEPEVEEDTSDEDELTID